MRLRDNTPYNVRLSMNFQNKGFKIKTNFISIDKCKFLISEIEENINSASNCGIRNIDKKILDNSY